MVLVEDKGLFALCIQYHGCLWHGDPSRQSISANYIELAMGLLPDT